MTNEIHGDQSRDPAKKAEPCTWLLGESADKPLVEISCLQTQIPTKGACRLSKEDSGIDRLAPLLQAVPSILLNNEVSGNHYLRVVVNGSLAAAADGDGLRGFVRDSRNQIVEHARFYEDGRLAGLASSAAVFQLVSAVVAQKHLADISAKLTEIKEGIDRLEKFLARERSSKVEGCLQYLHQVAPTVLAGKSLSSVRVRLEAVEPDLYGIQIHVRKDIDALIEEVKGLVDPSMFGTQGLTSALTQRQERMTLLVEEWMHCLAVRFVACRLLSIYPEDAELMLRRERTLTVEAETFFSEVGPLECFRRVVREHMQGLSSWFDSKATIYANQTEIKDWEIKTLPMIRNKGGRQLEQLQQLAISNDEPVTLTIKMEKGQCVEAYCVDANAPSL